MSYLHKFFIVLLLIAVSVSAASLNEYFNHTTSEGLLPGPPIRGNDGCNTNELETNSVLGNLNLEPIKADTVLWTFLFYDDSEFPGYDPLVDFANECRSTDNVNVIVIQDDENNPAFLYQVLTDGNLLLLEELGEVNMGSGVTLQNFIEYGKVNFPAERYFLAMFDHGGGWWGACSDITSSYDLIDMDEMYTAIENVGGVDILAFTAPCLMGALESAFELRNSVDVYIGSEELSGYILWRGIMDDIAYLLDTSASMSNAEIGSIVVDLVESNFPPEWSDWATMCAVNQSALEPMVSEFSQLCIYMEANINDVAPNIAIVRDSVIQMGMGGTYEYPEIDFGDFLEVFLAIETDPYIVTELQTIQQLFEETIINDCYGPLYTRAHGLSINFPPIEEGSYMNYYTSASLDFADQTNWDEFLYSYYEWQALGIHNTNKTNTLTIQPLNNPARSQIDFVCSGSEQGTANLSIYDITGRAVFYSTSFIEAEGISTISWNGNSLLGETIHSGIYFARITDSLGNTASTRVVFTAED